jgi:P4 family phage/plasmid primase-like protien
MDDAIPSITGCLHGFTLTEYLREFLANQHEVSEIELADSAAIFLKETDHVAIFDEGALWKYVKSDGVFRRMPDAEIKNSLYDLHGAPLARGQRFSLRPHQANNIVRVLKDRLHEPGYFLKANDGLALPNGFLTMCDGSLELPPHSPTFRQRGYVPIPYQPDSDNKEIDEFLLDVLEAQELVDLIYEIAGVALMGQGAVYQTIIVFHGEGANGKGVVTKLIQNLFPPELRSSISPSEWKMDFQRYRLFGSRFNAVGELPRLDNDTINWLKSICAGDSIMGRPVGGNQFEFSPVALHLFSTNNLPAITEQGTAIKRRFLVIPFNKVIPEEDRDYGLADRLFEVGKTGLLRRAIEGYERVLERGDIARPRVARLAAARWLERSNPIKVFAHECLDKTDDPSDRIGSSEMFERCAAFCKANQFPVPTSIKALAPVLETLGYQKAKSGTIYWVGVRERTGYG